MNVDDATIGVIGLGYVGLPLAIEFSKHFPVVGFDIDDLRIMDLNENHDKTGEASVEDLIYTSARFTSMAEDLLQCNVFIITVPTPINDANQPDLSPLESASQLVGRRLKKDAIIIYESTVYPGATEEVCVPILEQHSGLKFNEDFFVGYSPERINPGDPDRSVTSIMKVVSGSDNNTLYTVNELYKRIIMAGTYKASSIKVAEAAKVIENTQRDVNIALINELSMIFNKMDIDTEEVLDAAGTKWNFLPFRPGLVGGHCIGVDPYYLTYKAQKIGYHPQIILAGRRVNDGMGAYVASQIVKGMSNNDQCISGSRVLIMGYTFKENCPDTRNTKVIDIIDELTEYGAKCEVYDPWMDTDEILPDNLSRIETLNYWYKDSFDVIVLAVAHNEFVQAGTDVEYWKQYGKANALFFDVKSAFPADDVDWRL